MISDNLKHLSRINGYINVTISDASLITYYIVKNLSLYN